MNEFHRSACGLDPEEPVRKARGKNAKKEMKLKTEKDGVIVLDEEEEDDEVEGFRVLFPTERNVKGSVLGVDVRI